MQKTNTIATPVRNTRVKAVRTFLLGAGLMFLASCSNYFKNDYKDNSPTSGLLKVYYDEGLALHVKNQALTFESQYPNAHLELFETSESDAVQALYLDSCESIVISRFLTDKEKKAFEARRYFPNYSAVAKSGVAVICNAALPLNGLSVSQVKEMLGSPYTVKDSLGRDNQLTLLFDRNNSAVLHYMMDSILKKNKLSPNCNILNSTTESINYVAKHKNTLAFIDFAWLSDADDSIYKANTGKIRILGISSQDSGAYELPSQSSFKLNTYPFIRTVCVIRKTGDFTLAKGFESFVAGPKGQLTFLKQGLLPTRQTQRDIRINMEARPDKNQ